MFKKEVYSYYTLFYIFNTYTMKKVVLFSGLMLLVLLASCNKAQQEEVVSVLTDDTSTTQEVAMEKTDEGTMELASGFSNYDESLVGDREDTVLFFHQESCGTCKTTEKNLIENGVPDTLQVLKIDIDSDDSVELKKKYGVTMKHTFVQVDSEGNLVKKWNGSMDANDIVEKLDHSDAMMEKTEDAMMKDDTAMEKEDAMMVKAGTYSDYSPSLVGNTENTVVFFHAAWCPSCRAADSKMSWAEVPAGLTILKADYDSETDLRKKYGVASQHTFVLVDASGEMIKKWVGGTTVEDIVEKI